MLGALLSVRADQPVHPLRSQPDLSRCHQSPSRRSDLHGDPVHHLPGLRSHAHINQFADDLLPVLSSFPLGLFGLLADLPQRVSPLRAGCTWASVPGTSLCCLQVSKCFIKQILPLDGTNSESIYLYGRFLTLWVAYVCTYVTYPIK